MRPPTPSKPSADAADAFELIRKAWLSALPESIDNGISHCDQLVRTTGAMAADTTDLHRIAHDFKGQAGQFGLDLLASIGDRICTRLIAHSASPADHLLPVIKAHFVAARFVAIKQIPGDGGDAGQAILQRLDNLNQSQLAA